MNNNIINNKELDSIATIQSPLNIKLSKRQEQVLEALSQGLIYKEIAHMYHISENTVAYHMMELRKKLDCKNSREILAKAQTLSLI